MEGTPYHKKRKKGAKRKLDRRKRTSKKDTRMRNMHHSLTMAKQRVKGLQSKMDHLIDNQGIHLVEHDASDTASLMKELNPIVQESFQPHTPQRLFWDQQIAYNALKDKRQMRWHPLVIRFALNLKYLSTSSYRAMRQSGIIHLPSERTQSDYTHWTKPHSGISLDVIEEFVRMMEDVPTLVQQKSVYRDLKTMNVEPVQDFNLEAISRPLQKRARVTQTYL